MQIAKGAAVVRMTERVFTSPHGRRRVAPPKAIPHVSDRPSGPAAFPGGAP